MQNQQVQYKPTAAYYLSLIGGIIGLIIGIFTLIFLIGFWIIISSIIVIVSAQRLMSEPMEHTKWGTIILIFSIIGIGSLLGLVGGILALVYRPIPLGAQEASGGYAQPIAQAPITRICPQCGCVIGENVKFCPYCGKELP